MLVGDSLTASYQDEVAALLHAKGYQVWTAGRPGRSLLDANMCGAAIVTWLRAVHDPDVVVLEGIANYRLLESAGVPPCLPLVVPNSADFYREWKRAAKANTRAAARKRSVWVLTPQTRIDAGLAQINGIYRGLRTRTVDAWSSFGGSVYNPALHVADGVHLNQAGQDRLAALVVAAVG